MKAPRVELICVGTELLLGKVNTHAAQLGVELAKIGLSISREHTVPDDRDVMRQTFAESLRRVTSCMPCLYEGSSGYSRDN